MSPQAPIPLSRQLHEPFHGDGDGAGAGVTHVLSVSADGALDGLRDREVGALRRQIGQSIQLEQLKTNFLKLVSHELRAPLGVVSGYLSMLEDGTFGKVGSDVAPI